MNLPKDISYYVNVVRYHFFRLSFIWQKDNRALRKLVAFAADNDFPLPLENARFQTSLFSLNSWRIDKQDQPYFYAYVEKFLADHAMQSSKRFWQLWLTSCRESEHTIDPLKPVTARALFQAQQHSLIKVLSQPDLDYLLQSYIRSYGSLLTNTSVKQARHLLPLLIEYASIAQLTKPGPEALKVFQRWLANARMLPRAVTALSDADALQAPIRGIGSPHGVCATYYRADDTRELVRMAFAGTTGDATLNAHLFACFFAVALACDSEPTILTMGGGIFTLKSRQEGGAARTAERLISAVIGPAGPLEPKRGVAALGMTPQEAIMLTATELQEIQEDTGLMHQLQDASADPARALEATVARQLAAKPGSVRELRSDPSAPATSAIHMMPMMHRRPGNVDDVTPIQIEVPYSVLGPRKVFTLLRTTRSAYMQQLIITGERRRAFAEQIFREQDTMVKLWAQLSEAQKQTEWERRPFVFITSHVDFELDIVIPVDPPEEVDTREYEEYRRPMLRELARRQAEQFGTLCQLLVELNQEGGRADNITFKLLVDSMIRRAPLPIASAEFQQEYQDWVQISAAPIWATIEQWAINRGLSPRALAADNIVFNARVDAERERLVLQPWVMLDLHDYVVSIDSERGLMEIQPGARTQTIDELLKTDRTLGVTDLGSLHARYSQWIATKLGLEQPRDQKEQEAQSAILRDVDVGTLIQLQLAKEYLFRGDVANAQQMVDRIKKYDKAAIYFWGAIIKQYGFLSQFMSKPYPVTALQWTTALINIASTIVSSAAGGKDQLIERLNALRPLLGDELERVAEEARPYLSQLRATKDNIFLQGLADDANIAELEMESFRLEEESKRRYYAARNALSSLQYLRLAESIKEAARSLSFTNGTTVNIGRQIGELQTQAEAIPFAEKSVVNQISDLAVQFGAKSHGENRFNALAEQFGAKLFGEAP